MPGHCGKGMKGKKSGKMNGLKKATKAIAAKKKMKAKKKQMPYSKYTPKQKRLAAMYGDKKKITRGDIITAAKKRKTNGKSKKTKRS